MSVINFTTGDVLRSKTLPNEWYKWQITNVLRKPSTAGDSNNTVVTFTLIEHSPQTDGKEIVRYFSDKAISMMIPLVCAVRGIPQESLKPEGFQFDTDELLGKKIDGLITTETYEGNLKNVLDTYAPYGTPHQSAF